MNSFYQFSEQVATKALLDSIGEDNYEKSLKKLINETMEIANLMMEFCGECITVMLKIYLNGENLQFDDFEKIEIENPASHKDAFIPYFIETDK